MPDHTVIIGGGFAGIAAALELKALGVPSLLLDAEPTLGGKARTLNVRGVPVERGPVSFNGRHVVLWQLLGRLGLTDAVFPVGGRGGASARYVVRDGKLEGLKPHPLSALRTGAFSRTDKLSVLAEARKPRRTSGGPESVRAFFTRRFGSSLADGAIAAMVTGIFAGDPDRLAIDVCFPDLVRWERDSGSVLRGALKAARGKTTGVRRGVFTLHGGLGRIGARAMEVLTVKTSARVSGLERNGSAWKVKLSDGSVLDAPAVIVATEAAPASKLLWPVLPQLAPKVGEAEYAPISLVHWREARVGGAKLPSGFGYLSPPRERLYGLGTLFMSDLRGDGLGAYATFVGGALNPLRAQSGDDELLAGVQGDLSKLTGGAVGELLHVERWADAVYQPTLGHHARLDAIHAALDGTTLQLAGSHLGASALKDAVESGVRAATQVASALKSSDQNDARREPSR